MKTIFKRSLCLGLILLFLVPSIVACKKDQKGDGESESVSDVVETDAAEKDTLDTDTEADTESDAITDTEVDTEADTEEESVKDVDEDTEEETEKETEEETENKYDVYDDLGDIDLDGREINIASSNHPWLGDEIAVDRFSGEVVSDAIYKRNMMVEARLNAKLNNILLSDNLYDPGNDVIMSINGGTHMYDLVLAATYTSIIRTAEGAWRDLTNYDSLDLSKPYWNQLFNEQMSIGGSQYMATGAISLSYYRMTYVTLVNDNLLNSHPGAPDLFSVVDDNKWTIEYQKNLAKDYYHDATGNGKDSGDTFGFVTQLFNGSYPYLSSCEINMMSKGPDGYYQLALDTNKLHNVVDQLLELFSAESTYTTMAMSNWDEVEKIFSEGRALMINTMLRSIESHDLVNMQDGYSILPVAKYSEDQDTYYSFVHDSFTAMAIPASAPEWDCDVFASVMEALASESYRTVTPAYYEVALKRYANNLESIEMLDMITQNVYVDPAMAYIQRTNQFFVKIRDIVKSDGINGTGNTVSSTYSGEYMETIRKDIARLNAAIKDYQAVS